MLGLNENRRLDLIEVDAIDVDVRSRLQEIADDVIGAVHERLTIADEQDLEP